MTVQQILDTVRDTYGISFNETHTGGGCCALEARLETGHWIVATDEGLCGFRERLDWEDDRSLAAGWMIGIYENNTDHGDDWWGGGDLPVVDVTDYDAYAADLPRLVGVALRELVEVL